MAGFVPALMAAATVLRPFVASALLSAAMYAAKKWSRDEPMTAAGAATAVGFGFAGGFGGAMGNFSGSLAGQALWRLNAAPITMAGQAIATDQ